MLTLLTNWKTTAGGVGAILGALADIAISLSHGNVPNVTADFAAITAGLGLIAAKDGNVTGGTIHQ